MSVSGRTGRSPASAGDAPLLRSRDGSVVGLSVDRWHDQPSPVEMGLLDMVDPPALDVGCGPGRFVAVLSGRGIPTLGIDPSPVAVDSARAKGAPVLRRSIFDRVPGAGRWRTALLFDENVGIGGDPCRLFRRLRDLLAPSGTVISEVARPGTASALLRVRFERGSTAGPWFDWATLAADDIGRVADEAGMEAREVWEAGGRWFAQLSPADDRLSGRHGTPLPCRDRRQH